MLLAVMTWRNENLHRDSDLQHVYAANRANEIRDLVSEIENRIDVSDRFKGTDWQKESAAIDRKFAQVYDRIRKIEDELKVRRNRIEMQ